jgi:hypothetical protein
VQHDRREPADLTVDIVRHGPSLSHRGWLVDQSPFALVL